MSGKSAVRGAGPKPSYDPSLIWIANPAKVSKLPRNAAARQLSPPFSTSTGPDGSGSAPRVSSKHPPGDLKSPLRHHHQQQSNSGMDGGREPPFESSKPFDDGMGFDMQMPFGSGNGTDGFDWSSPPPDGEFPPGPPMDNGFFPEGQGGGPPFPEDFPSSPPFGSNFGPDYGPPSGQGRDDFPQGPPPPLSPMEPATHPTGHAQHPPKPFGRPGGLGGAGRPLPPAYPVAPPPPVLPPPSRGRGGDPPFGDAGWQEPFGPEQPNSRGDEFDDPYGFGAIGFGSGSGSDGFGGPGPGPGAGGGADWFGPQRSPALPGTPQSLVPPPTRQGGMSLTPPAASSVHSRPQASARPPPPSGGTGFDRGGGPKPGLGRPTNPAAGSNPVRAQPRERPSPFVFMKQRERGPAAAPPAKLPMFGDGGAMVDDMAFEPSGSSGMMGSMGAMGSRGGGPTHASQSSYPLNAHHSHNPHNPPSANSMPLQRPLSTSIETRPGPGGRPRLRTTTTLASSNNFFQNPLGSTFGDGDGDYDDDEQGGGCAGGNGNGGDKNRSEGFRDHPSRFTSFAKNSSANVLSKRLSAEERDMLRTAIMLHKKNFDLPLHNIHSDMDEVYFDVNRIQTQQDQEAFVSKKRKNVLLAAVVLEWVLKLLPFGLPGDDIKKDVQEVLEENDYLLQKQFILAGQPAPNYSDKELYIAIAIAVMSRLLVNYKKKKETAASKATAAPVAPMPAPQGYYYTNGTYIPVGRGFGIQPMSSDSYQVPRVPPPQPAPSEAEKSKPQWGGRGKKNTTAPSSGEEPSSGPTNMAKLLSLGQSLLGLAPAPSPAPAPSTPTAPPPTSTSMTTAGESKVFQPTVTGGGGSATVSGPFLADPPFGDPMFPSLDMTGAGDFGLDAPLDFSLPPLDPLPGSDYGLPMDLVGFDPCAPVALPPTPAPPLPAAKPAPPPSKPTAVPQPQPQQHAAHQSPLPAVPAGSVTLKPSTPIAPPTAPLAKPPNVPAVTKPEAPKSVAPSPPEAQKSEAKRTSSVVVPAPTTIPTTTLATPTANPKTTATVGPASPPPPATPAVGPSPAKSLTSLLAPPPKIPVAISLPSPTKLLAAQEKEKPQQRPQKAGNKARDV